MSDILSRDQNHVTVLGGVTDNVAQDVTMLRVDPTTKRLLVSAAGLPGGGTVTTISVATANGFAGTVANPTTTPAITLSTTVTGILSGNGTAISAASTTGTGAVVLATSPTLVTPNLGVASATSLNVAGDIASTGNTISVASAGTGTIYVSRGATTNFASQVFKTNLIDQWTIGLRNDSTNNFYIRDNVDSVNIISATQAATPAVTAGGTWTFVAPVLGTPSSGVATNLTGTASGLTAGTVTTNANLTGAVTSSGNATSLGSFSSASLSGALTDETGSGSAVFGTNPTIAKPVMNARNQTAQTYSPTAAGTATLDLSLADQHYVAFPAGNITLAVSNDTNNQIFYVTLTQDSGGSRTVTWFAGISWAGGTVPTLTTTANKKDCFIFVRTGSNTYNGFIVGQAI